MQFKFQNVANSKLVKIATSVLTLNLLMQKYSKSKVKEWLALAQWSSQVTSTKQLLKELTHKFLLRTYQSMTLTSGRQFLPKKVSSAVKNLI